MCDTIKRANLRITGRYMRKESHNTFIEHIFNQIIKENFPKLKKVTPIQCTYLPDSSLRNYGQLVGFRDRRSFFL